MSLIIRNIGALISLFPAWIIYIYISKPFCFIIIFSYLFWSLLVSSNIHNFFSWFTNLFAIGSNTKTKSVRRKSDIYVLSIAWAFRYKQKTSFFNDSIITISEKLRPLHRFTYARNINLCHEMLRKRNYVSLKRYMNNMICKIDVLFFFLIIFR